MRSNAASARSAVVLIASKHEWASRSLESILAPRGYVVVKAFTARHTLERAGLDQPDAIIVDVALPDGDGHELCRQLRARGLAAPSTPILLTLPKPPLRRDRLAALQAGAWDCLGEPLDAEQVLATLDTFVPAKLDADQARSEGLVDHATGLYNVRGLTRRAQELASFATRNHAALACVLLAPEHTPEREDAADDSPPALVSRVADALKAAGRRSDAIGRVGPSAFAVVAMDTDAAQARQLAERLRGAILSPPDIAAGPAATFRLHAGYHAVADFHAASIDTVDLMLCATAALRDARGHPGGEWIRRYDGNGGDHHHAAKPT